ncbi:peptidase domain-containing ABC transporter [Desulfolutivibrio sulfoxidireducens]|uniref:peptidase domain-containing ABC transporter n=1 Tax=Desulfolutivibrio sulfoxidireducens TaxID=2773299 RepID=UPI00159DEE49|nr:peptidase domain-containing ABC transporter [Desulfolutivibrio sulfoxidireducens]QLA18203.1 ATP-binding cassette domain-containing protein [Desulfolutivibrio sulfoxidireducens]
MSQVNPGNQTAILCFLMVARHFHLDFTLEGIVHKYALQDTEAPVTLLLRIAKEHGFRARETRLRWEDIPGMGKAFPAIARLTSGKSIILSGVHPGEDPKLVFLDPLDMKAGFKFLSKEEATAIWDGTTILIKREYKLTDAEQPFSLRWFLPEILREKGLFRDVAASAMILNILALGSPIFFQLVIDKVLVHKGFSTLQTLAIGMVVLLLFDAAFSAIKKVMLLYATNKIDMRLARRTFNHLLYLPAQFFENSSAGVLLKHMQQTEKIRAFLTGRLLFTLLDLSVLVVIFPILFMYSVTLSVIVFASALLVAVILGVAIPIFKRRLQDLYMADGERQATLVEAIHGMPTVKALALEPLQSRNWDTQSARTISMQFRVGKLSVSIQTLTDFIQKVASVVLIWVGVTLVFDNQLTVGALIAFNMLAQRVSTPLVGFVSLLHQYQEVGLSIEMLGNIMNRPTERPLAVRGLTPQITGRIDFEHVTFRYSPTASFALNDVNLSVPAGASVGVVGRSGSGKSTLARLLQGIYPVQTGNVKIDGLDVREIDLPHLRRCIGMVLQDNFLFRGTVRQNIAYTKPSASFEEVVVASRMAGADEFIQNLSQGYDTPITENGSNLSGGQRQRLSIARSLLLNPRILILDEATSALDAESEAIIQNNLASIGKGRTMFIISHRLSMIAGCDGIVVIDRGNIVAVGKHAELLSSCRLYRELWEAQNRHSAPVPIKGSAS